MRNAASVLLCGVATAAALRIPRDAPQLISAVVPDIVPIPTAIPEFGTHTWQLLSPEEAITSLHSKALATPSAVSLVPGLVFPTNLASLEHDIGTVTGGLFDGLLEDVVPNPTLEEVPQEPKKQAQKEAPKKAPKKAHHASSGVENAKSSNSNKNTLQSCKNPQIRPEWRNMADQDKTNYVNAIKCLMTKPAKSKLPGVKTRYDDMVAVHQHMNTIIHGVGQFLPWHRYYLHIFYSLLQSECSYRGPLPWWDETKDAGDFNGAPPFTQQYEGHMPVLPPTACITSGVFANTVCNIGPQSSNVPHCLARGVNETLSSYITMNFVNICNSNNDYNSMWFCQYRGVHGYGHDAIGGVMSDVQTSPGDPAFFLHHAFVDRNWRIWQRTDPSSRTYAIGGWTTQNCLNGGSGCTPTTLNYMLNSLGLAGGVTIDKVMDTQGGYLCYHYDY